MISNGGFYHWRRQGQTNTIPQLDAHAPLHRLVRLRNKLLSHRSGNPQLRQHRLPPFDRTSLCPVRDDRVRQRLACRPYRRALLPHHYPALVLRRVFHHRGSHYEYCAEIFRHDVDGAEYLYGICGCVGLDLKHLAKTAR